MFMTKKIIICLTLILMILNCNNTFSQNSITNNRKAYDVVKKSMKVFLDSIPANMLINYGINSKSEINNATVGNPIAIFSLSNDSVVFTDSWRVPLVINNEYKALFTVFKNKDNEYKIVDFGATILAHDIYLENKKVKLKGLLRVNELRKHYFISDNINGVSEFKSVPNLGKPKMVLKDILNESK